MTAAMIRLLLALGLTFSLCLAAAADDQPEPPVRLKKKARAEPGTPARPRDPMPPGKSEPPRKPDDQKPREEKETQVIDPQELQQKIHEVMNRLTKNLRMAEDRLSRKDTGRNTQQVQQDIVKDLEQLIAQTRQQQEQQQSSSSSSASAAQSQQARRSRMGQRPRPEPRPEPSQQTPNNTAAGGGNGGRGDKSKIADLYKDVWGHLPEALRQEMDQYSREQFMAKYNELLKQYYSTIAEKGRSKASSR
jgi:type IV secretory pathway VirB10-like protein